MTHAIPTPYEDLLREILEENKDAIAADAQRSDRTGTGTFGVFGRQMRFDLRESFPLITTKRVHFKSVAIELLWFLRGSSNVRWLQERGVTIWDEWADENGDLGPVYGVQWRSWPTPDGGTIDQIAKVIDSLQNKPSPRLPPPILFRHGTLPRWTTWRFRPATHSSSSTCTNARTV